MSRSRRCDVCGRVHDGIDYDARLGTECLGDDATLMHTGQPWVDADMRAIPS
jgi:hypothetical protein